MTKKIIYIIGSLEVGGTERHLTALLPELAARGFNVSVFTFVRKGELAKQLEAVGIMVETLVPNNVSEWANHWPKFLARPWLALWVVWALYKKFRQIDAEILHFFLPQAYLLGMLAARFARYSGHLVMSRRSQNHYQKKYPWVAFLERIFHQKTSLILCNSQDIVSELQKEGASLQQIKLIYNGVELKPTSNDMRLKVREAMGIAKEALLFIIVANLIPYKGHSDLLHALSNIKHQLPHPWALFCVGRDDGIGLELRELAKTLGLSSNIMWLGSRSDVHELLSASDIGVLCSHEEGFSNAILEGMAAMLPMVVTRVGGNAEAVLQNETGCIVEAKNSENLGQALLDLALDRARARILGQNGRHRVEQHFSMKACVNGYEKLYHDLCSRNVKNGNHKEKI